MALIELRDIHRALRSLFLNIMICSNFFNYHIFLNYSFCHLTYILWWRSTLLIVLFYYISLCFASSHAENVETGKEEKSRKLKGACRANDMERYVPSCAYFIFRRIFWIAFLTYERRLKGIHDVQITSLRHPCKDLNYNKDILFIMLYFCMSS